MTWTSTSAYKLRNNISIRNKVLKFGLIEPYCMVGDSMVLAYTLNHYHMH